MIRTIKIETDKGTEWDISGHAPTDICNGYSALLCTFVEELKDQAEDLKFVIERREQKITYNGYKETVTEGGGDSNYIWYKGRPSAESFFQTGIRLMSENTDEVEPLQILHA